MISLSSLRVWQEPSTLLGTRSIALQSNIEHPAGSGHLVSRPASLKCQTHAADKLVSTERSNRYLTPGPLTKTSQPEVSLSHPVHLGCSDQWSLKTYKDNH